MAAATTLGISYPLNPIASIVITTKNRRAELATAICSALAQIGSPEVIVIDDGSTDGTAEMVQTNFPEVRLERSVNSLGLIVQRNRGARLARGEIIFSIDDDAEFSSERVVEQTLADFVDSHIGVVAIPYLEPRKDDCLRQSAPDGEQIWVTSEFIGTAHALRRDVFLALGGYREALFQQGEEGDYAIRMLAAGYVTRLGCAEPIKHWESPNRDYRRMDLYGPRNSILFVWQNTPWQWLLVNLLATTINCLTHGLSLRRTGTRVAGVLSGYRECLRSPRQPVSLRVFRLWRRLRMNSPHTLDNIVVELPRVDSGVPKCM